MIEDVSVKERVLQIFKKRDVDNYVKCPAKNCPMFDIVETGPGVVMYFCMTHNFNSNVAI